MEEAVRVETKNVLDRHTQTSVGHQEHLDLLAILQVRVLLVCPGTFFRTWRFRTDFLENEFAAFPQTRKTPFADFFKIPYVAIAAHEFLKATAVARRSPRTTTII